MPPRRKRTPEEEQASSQRHFLLILAGILLVFCICTVVFILGMRYKRQAEEFAKQKRYYRSFVLYTDNAESALQAARRALGTNDPALIGDARSRIIDAKGWLDGVLKKNPEYAEAWRVRGRLKTFLRDLDGAEVDFDRYEALAGEDHRLADFDRARVTALRILRGAAGGAPAEWIREQGRPAADRLRRFLDWMRDISKVRIDQAYSFAKMMPAKSMYDLFVGNFSEAAFDLKIATSFDPGDPLYPDLHAVALLYSRDGNEAERLAKAQKILDRSLLVSENFPETWALLGRVHHLRKNFEAAEQAFARAARMTDAGFIEALVGVGRAQLELGKLDDALTHLSLAEQAQRRSGRRSWRVYHVRARVYRRIWLEETRPEKERTDAILNALVDLDTAEEIDPRQVPIFVLRARIERDRGRLNRAVEDLDYCVRLAPEDPEARLLRARVNLERRRREAALRDLDELARLNKKRGLGLDSTLARLRKAAERLPEAPDARQE